MEMLYYSLAADVCVPSVRTNKRKLLSGFQLADEMLLIGLIGLIINWTENQRQLTAYSQAFSLQNKSLPDPSPLIR